MKIIIAPAKQLKYKNTSIEFTKPKYLSKQKGLLKILKTYSVEQIHDIMKISFKMANEVYNFYHQKQDSCPAIFMYSGTVFKQLPLSTYNEDDFNYLNQHLRIMSAYYGTLHPSDAIAPYRLDMTMKIEGIDLYQYWHRVIKKHFKEEDFILSLASKEFTKMVDHPNIITIDFVEDKAGKLTRNATKLKEARGKMLHLMIKQKITTLEDIKKISFDDYTYDEILSTDTNYVFYRKAGLQYLQK